MRSILSVWPFFYNLLTTGIRHVLRTGDRGVGIPPPLLLLSFFLSFFVLFGRGGGDCMEGVVHPTAPPPTISVWNNGNFRGGGGAGVGFYSSIK